MWRRTRRCSPPSPAPSTSSRVRPSPPSRPSFFSPNRACPPRNTFPHTHNHLKTHTYTTATFGTIPNVKAKGPHAAVALQRFLSLKKQRLIRRQQQQQQLQQEQLSSEDDGEDEEEGGGGRGVNAPPEIDTLVILDRAVDFVTPLLTPLTYEGVIDEFIGIHNGAIKVDPSLVGDE